MKKFYYIIFTTLLLVTLLLSASSWFYAEQILNQLLRPEIEKTATQWLQAQVQINQLTWSDGELKVLGVNIKSPQQLIITIPEVMIKVTLRNLWSHQLDVLHLKRPRIEILQPPHEEEAVSIGLKIPDHLPFTISEVILSDGLLLFNHADQKWQLRKLNFSGALQPNSRFTLSSFWGADDSAPLDIAGKIEISPQQILTLNKLTWQQQQLLTTPMQIAFSGADMNLDRTHLQLEQFDQSKLQELLNAFGQPLQLPEALTFSLRDADLVFSLHDQAITFELQIATGQLGWDQKEGSLTEFNISGQLTPKNNQWVAATTVTIDEVGLPDLTIRKLLATAKLNFRPDQLHLDNTEVKFNLASDHGLSGQVNMRGSGEFSSQQGSLELQQLSLSHCDYMSTDGMAGVGEAGIKLQGRLHGLWSEGSTNLDLHGTVTAHEALLGELYANLSPYRGEFSFTGEINPQLKTVTATAVTINIPQVGQLTARGRLHRQQFSVQGDMQMADLHRSYGEHLGPVLAEILPTLADLKLEGAISLDYKLDWNPADWQTHGALQFRDVNVDWGEQKLQIESANGSIPFVIHSGTNPSAPPIEATGRMVFSTISNGLTTLKQKSLDLLATDNRLTFLSPLQLQLAGGQVTVDDLKLQWAKGEPQGSALINIDNVNLETLTKELNLPIMQGQLSANLGTLHYADQNLMTTGLARIQVFDGLLQLRNMKYSAPFSRYPSFETDIDFYGLNLLQATKVFDFGEMNGVIDGHIHGLKLFGTTPAAFEATVTTRDTGKRNISVKALNNLSVISQGGMTAALSRGIYRFIDFYRFQKIGFKCALDNDNFTLLGTALSGSNKYLVYGGFLPPKIDITTTTPTISFKEMMNRLSRIDRTGN
ncbi:hypothetical protein SAMN05660420_00835 [Desulfuromusa kysingii]|uniref:AsmA-like C-terminal region n=1 Tax=Desulfuromusa kysingii TaxID=37625 RepID=A0A1H3X5L8_9BACT|nr:hypothetical protein [Desulfuromusa kysingii]SDZ94697.1 hypothetical protein SAMN05660420_00835 [Desulfuromusa kysingii]